ncbi:hypothetical protein [Kitasatospora sp. McL0602]|uniref:hypothetical protein n=1 Tax=Kitasatospora sp. McL0602 TaxID=3439530 RepID=UPI003F8B76AC
MGILDRLLHRPHETVDPAQRAALAHDEAADAFAVDVEKAAERTTPPPMTEQDRQAASDMTAEGDPWD